MEAAPLSKLTQYATERGFDVRSTSQAFDRSSAELVRATYAVNYALGVLAAQGVVVETSKRPPISWQNPSYDSLQAIASWTASAALDVELTVAGQVAEGREPVGLFNERIITSAQSPAPTGPVQTL